MRQTQAKTKELLEQIKKEGLTTEVVQKINTHLLALNTLIEEGAHEYGTTDVSTPESQCYEDAVIAEIEVQKVLDLQLPIAFQYLQNILDKRGRFAMQSLRNHLLSLHGIVMSL
jgi:hypothetical protein